MIRILTVTGDDGEDLLSALIATFSDEEDIEALVEEDEAKSNSLSVTSHSQALCTDNTVSVLISR